MRCVAMEMVSRRLVSRRPSWHVFVWCDGTGVIVFCVGCVVHPSPQTEKVTKWADWKVVFRDTAGCLFTLAVG